MRLDKIALGFLAVLTLAAAARSRPRCARSAMPLPKATAQAIPVSDIEAYSKVQ